MKSIVSTFLLLALTPFHLQGKCKILEDKNRITGKDAAETINGFYKKDDLAIKIGSDNKVLAIYRYKEEGQKIIGNVVGTYDPDTGLVEGKYCERWPGDGDYSGHAKIVFIRGKKKKGKHKIEFVACYTEDLKSKKWKDDWDGTKTDKSTPKEMDLFESKKGLCFLKE